ncbi:hypothetical protein [Ottowia testudinis]|uniref:Uncharacterized protein n=1 Tax=Ottowia testudinis TaxID=2816950 RepID=A0A975CKA4_9BURK|nr:hypothetical protein [Ottowia testudinis]QTD46552.1 hypothetical protein J1M35_06655 [Ottowia testudinis]
MHSRADSQVQGVLHAVGGSGGFDWLRPSVFTGPIPSSGALKLQSRFIWNVPAVISDHAIVAFVQGLNSNWINSQNNDSICKYGVGAFVSDLGLSIEFWFNPNNNHLGSAYVWNSVNICGIGMGPDASPNPQLCLSTPNTAGAYITPRPPNWPIVAGREYWVRVKISADSTPNWYTLEAELVDPSYPGWLV